RQRCERRQIERLRSRRERLRRRRGSWCRQGREVMAKWNPWKITALAMALVMATALITGLVVANWSGSSQEAELKGPTSPRLAQPRPAGAKPAPPPARTVQ